MNTPWKTNEFGLYDLNNNAIFIIDDTEEKVFTRYELFKKIESSNKNF
jgi:hypothetical protein